MKLMDFYRNIAFDERYDENSFIGKILDYNYWSDKEYWKLEKDLIKILKFNQNKKFIKQEFMEGIASICNDVFLNISWSCVDIYENDKSFKLDKYIIGIKEPSIEDRFRRLKNLLLCISYDDKGFFDIDFCYRNK